VIADAPLPPHTVALEGRAPVAERTIEIRLAKPPRMSFKPGQYMDLTLLATPEEDEGGKSRSFSISSAPGEETLSFVTRLRDSAFKRSLEKMPLGSGIQVEGPFGDFTLHQKIERPAVLLAGGIGVTPFRSMVLDSLEKGSSRRIFLFHSNRRPEDAPFLEEFRSLSERHPNFTFVPTMSRPEQSRIPWKGVSGRIEVDLIQKHLRGAASEDAASAGPVFYIAGPPQMVAALRAILAKAGIQDDDIRTEEFTGY
jgi:ferredoxin-NADP reductase